MADNLTFLSPKEVSQLVAGRELDALLAESFFGWFCQSSGNGFQVYSPSDSFDFPKCYGWWAMGQPRLGDRQPHYSTRIADAWLVVEELNRRGQLVDLTRRKDHDRGTFPYECEIWNCSGEPETTAVADDAALAICRAALLAFLPSSAAPIDKNTAL